MRKSCKCLVLHVVPGHKPSTHSPTFPSDRTVRPATPEKSPTHAPYRRSASNSAGILETKNAKAGQSKFVTVGAAIGAKLAGQVKAMEARRARVLPNEHLDPADADEIVPKESGTFYTLHVSAFQ